jgi:prepilin-type N-terminal cleavage/methylation domain-containing protein
VSILRDERGFTLIEAIVVCAILGVVLAGLTTVFVGGTHAELQLNNRFKAQEGARLGVDALRIDAHNACAANIAVGGGKVTFAYVPGGDPSMCGAVGSSSTYPKTIWCALTSPTLSTAYALYRSTATDGTCTTANGTLEADRLTTNSNVFSAGGCSGGSICPAQYPTIAINLPVSYKTGTYGVTYTLSQTLALRNGVYQTTSTTTPCPTGSNNTTCLSGTCPANTASVCYPPVIQ